VYPLWYGTVERSNGNNTLGIGGRLMNFGNIAELFRVIVNGSTVHTSATYGVGQSVSINLAIDLSALTASTRRVWPSATAA
jgi:hypothetical protein